MIYNFWSLFLARLVWPAAEAAFAPWSPLKIPRWQNYSHYVHAMTSTSGILWLQNPQCDAFRDIGVALVADRRDIIQFQSYPHQGMAMAARADSGGWNSGSWVLGRCIGRPNYIVFVHKRHNMLYNVINILEHMFEYVWYFSILFDTFLVVVFCWFALLLAHIGGDWTEIWTTSMFPCSVVHSCLLLSNQSRSSLLSSAEFGKLRSSWVRSRSKHLGGYDRIHISG